MAFKYYNVYIIVNDHPKFMLSDECGGPKKTKINTDDIATGMMLST